MFAGRWPGLGVRGASTELAGPPPPRCRRGVNIPATATAAIARFGLQPLPREGGWFARTWTGPEIALPDGRRRPAGTSILFLLAGDEFSALHRLRGDEVWHFHAGDAVELLLLDERPAFLRANVAPARVRLGADLAAGDLPQLVVPAGVWQGARVARRDGWALLGCTLAPGWHDDDFELGERAALLARHPQFSDDIRALTRERPADG